MTKRLDRTEVEALKCGLLPALSELAAHLFPGCPVRMSGTEIRVGNNGSLSINRHTGCWYSHEAGDGGDIISLIEFALHADFKAAVDYARRFLGGSIPPATDSLSRASLKRMDEQRAIRNRARAKNLWMQARPIEGGVYADR